MLKVSHPFGSIMSHHCPKCNSTFESPEALPQQCPQCGVYFAKLGSKPAPRSTAKREQPDDEDRDPRFSWRYWLLPASQKDGVMIGGWALLLVIMLVWGAYFILCDWRSGEAMQSFLHQPDLAFHEAGHVLFIPLGEFMTILGGSLFQCLVPLILCIAFLRRHEPASAAACLWWMGQNMLDVAPYIADARALELSLVGESSEEIVEMRALRHDWHNILDRLNALDWDIALARLDWLLGSLVVVLSCVWLGYIIWQQWPGRHEAKLE